jgi:hypothetical protein
MNRRPSRPKRIIISSGAGITKISAVSQFKPDKIIIERQKSTRKSNKTPVLDKIINAQYFTVAVLAIADMFQHMKSPEREIAEIAGVCVSGALYLRSRRSMRNKAINDMRSRLEKKDHAKGIKYIDSYMNSAEVRTYIDNRQSFKTISVTKASMKEHKERQALIKKQGKQIVINQKNMEK